MPHSRTLSVVTGMLLIVAGCTRSPAPPPVAGEPPENAAPSTAANMGTNASPGLDVIATGGLDVAPASTGSRSKAAPAGEEKDLLGLVGTTPSRWVVSEWANGPALSWLEMRGKVLVVNFFRDDSESCRQTLPALEQLAERYSGQPVQFVGMYIAPSLSEEGAWPQGIQFAQSLGVKFPLAYDRNWRTLRTWWLAYHLNSDLYFELSPTTVTMVLDPAGKVVFAHPGPELHPSADPRHWQCNHDYLALERAIQQALPHNLADR